MEGTHSPLNSSGPTVCLSIKAFHTSPTRPPTANTQGLSPWKKRWFVLVVGDVISQTNSGKRDGVHGGHEGNGD